MGIHRGNGGAINTVVKNITYFVLKYDTTVSATTHKNPQASVAVVFSEFYGIVTVKTGYVDKAYSNPLSYRIWMS